MDFNTFGILPVMRSLSPNTICGPDFEEVMKREAGTSDPKKSSRKRPRPLEFDKIQGLASSPRFSIKVEYLGSKFQSILENTLLCRGSLK